MIPSTAPETRKIHTGLTLAWISIPIFIGAMDLTVISAVLPRVILDLEIPLKSGMDNAAWIVTGYLLAYSISMTFMGRLSDLYGRRTVYLLALVIFALGSYLIAVANTWPTDLALRIYYRVASGRPDVSFVTLDILIAARMIQAFGAGTMVPVGMAIVGDIYPLAGRARPLGLIAAVDTAGWVVGHLYGGIIVRFWPWETIFWLNIPVCILAFLIIWFMLGRIPQVQSRGSMDWLGTVLIAATLTLLNLGLGNNTGDVSSQSPGTSSISQPYAVPLLLLAAVFLGLFVWRQSKARHPLIDLSLFRRPNYLPASMMNLLVGGCLFIAIANVPLFINTLIAATPEQGAWDSGWMLSALTVPMALASIPGGWICEKFGYRLPAWLGMALAFTGFILMGTWVSETSYVVMAVDLVLGGVGIGLTMAPIAAAVLNASPADQRGTSSALVIIFRLIGMTLGVSGVTTFDLERAEALSGQWLSPAASLNETIEIGRRVIEQVISETFVIAAVLACLALVVTLFLKNHFQIEAVEA